MLKKNIYIEPQVISDQTDGKLFDLHTLIYEQLSAMQPGWEMHEYKAPASDIQDAEILLYHKSSKHPNLLYGFFVKQHTADGDHYVYINPANGTLDADNSIGTCRFVSTTPLYANNDHLRDKRIESALTIGIGKHNTSCFISVTPRNSGYILMNAVSGEDSMGNVYAFSPSEQNNSNNDPMRFTCREESISELESAVNWYTDTSSSTIYYSHNSMGTVMRSDILVLSPFVNPINGNICPDVFTPLCGPGIESRLYDVSVNGRTFITGSSNPAYVVGSTLKNEEYNVTYKVFMEV